MSAKKVVPEATELLNILTKEEKDRIIVALWKKIGRTGTMRFLIDPGHYGVIELLEGNGKKPRPG